MNDITHHYPILPVIHRVIAPIKSHAIFIRYLANCNSEKFNNDLSDKINNLMQLFIISLKIT